MINTVLRAKYAIFAALLLNGCIYYRTTSDLIYVNKDRFAGTVMSKPEMIFLGVGADSISMRYTVADCFDDEKKSERNSIPNRLNAFGVNPLKKVCLQYDGVDLLAYSDEVASCFLPIQVNGDTEYLHPWLAENPSDLCATVIAAMEKHKGSSNE